MVFQGFRGDLNESVSGGLEGAVRGCPALCQSVRLGCDLPSGGRTVSLFEDTDTSMFPRVDSPCTGKSWDG